MELTITPSSSQSAQVRRKDRGKEEGFANLGCPE